MLTLYLMVACLVLGYIWEFAETGEERIVVLLVAAFWLLCLVLAIIVALVLMWACRPMDEDDEDDWEYL